MSSTIISRMMARQKRWAWLLLGALIALGVAAWPLVETTAFLLDLAGHTGFPRSLLPVRPFDVTTESIVVPTRSGGLEARVYWPRLLSARTVIVFPGVHGGGLDEPRLATFSRRLAATGLTVISAPLPELRAFRITPRSTEAIRDVTLWVADQPRFAPRGRVGLVGVSFAGGLALVAAGLPEVAGRVSAVLSLGGHGDLARVLRYLCTGLLPDGTTRKPHDYGLAVLALAAAPRLAPADQALGLERIILTYLEASLDDDPEQPRGRPLLAQAARDGEQMPEPSRSFVRSLMRRDVDSLGRAILPYVDELAADPALSPERSPATTVPVFLIQGDEDNVIPSSETPRLAEYLMRVGGNRHVMPLLTPVLSHLGLGARGGLSDRWALVRAWRAWRAALD